MRGFPAPGNDGASIPGVRRGIGVAIVVAAAMSLAACGTSGWPAGSSSGSSSKGLTMWALNDQTILKASVDACNKDHPNQKITRTKGEDSIGKWQRCVTSTFPKVFRIQAMTGY